MHSSTRVHAVSPEERQFGVSVAQLLPPSPPHRFRLLDAAERQWRGRACIILWLSGFSASSAWRLAMSRDAGWSEYLRDELPWIVPMSLVVPVIRRRAAEAAGRAA
jgi:hypothetical protein